ncbi:hypothetical protein [Neobacillus jeddahensis]|uniref:hypothetical protein n=1 Tax=Neobacillus jeddahensis TaxID=1461580 RepID=UPI00058CD046|nr:hypothetical protein [Neobacillus jeddahensis]
MNPKVRKGIFWGGIIAAMILVMNLVHYLFGGASALAAGPYRHEQGGMGMGPRDGGMGPHHMMGHPQPGGFAWLWIVVFILIGITVLVLVGKGLRRKSKAAAMQQFIDTSIMSSHKPLTNSNAHVLEQWEKNLMIKKENQ